MTQLPTVAEWVTALARRTLAIQNMQGTRHEVLELIALKNTVLTMIFGDNERVSTDLSAITSADLTKPGQLTFTLDDTTYTIH